MDPETDPKRRENIEDMKTSESNHNKIFKFQILNNKIVLVTRFLLQIHRYDQIWLIFQLCKVRKIRRHCKTYFLNFQKMIQSTLSNLFMVLACKNE